MTGPESLTRLEQLATIARAVGRVLTFTEQAPAEFAAEMATYHVPPEVVAMLLAYWSDTVEQPEVPRPADLLLGRPARTLAEWAADHAHGGGGSGVGGGEGGRSGGGQSTSPRPFDKLRGR